MTDDNMHTPTVVLVHGGFADASFWTPVIKALQARGFLRRGTRTLAADRDGNHQAGEQHDIAHRQDDQRVFGQRTRRAFPHGLSGRSGAFGADARVGSHW